MFAFLSMQTALLKLEKQQSAINLMVRALGSYWKPSPPCQLLNHIVWLENIAVLALKERQRDRESGHAVFVMAVPSPPPTPAHHQWRRRLLWPRAIVKHLCDQGVASDKCPWSRHDVVMFAPSMWHHMTERHLLLPHAGFPHHHQPQQHQGTLMAAHSRQPSLES